MTSLKIYQKPKINKSELVLILDYIKRLPNVRLNLHNSFIILIIKVIIIIDENTLIIN